MPRSVSSVDVSKSFCRAGRCDRKVLALGDFTDDDQAQIASARMPPEAANLDAEIQSG